MKLLFTLLLIVNVTFSSGEVKKRHLAYGVIVAKADLIVHGKILSVSDDKTTYNFKVSDNLKGESKSIIIVNSWEEWACDKRIKPHKVDQELVLFLIKNKDSYNIIHGSSGELFVSETNKVSTFLNTSFPKVYELKKGIRLYIQLKPCVLNICMTTRII